MGRNKVFDQVFIGKDEKRPNIRSFAFRSDFFKDAEYYTIEECEGYFVVKKHRLEVPDNAFKITRNKITKRWQTGVNCETIPLGVFDIDTEDSDEDELYIYY